MRRIRVFAMNAFYTYALTQALRGLWALSRDTAYMLNERYTKK